MNNPWIAPSILSADLAHLGEQVDLVLSAGADVIHFDVMDNHYVPNLTFGPMVCAALRRYGVDAPIDVHLMIEPVDSLIPAFAAAGASLISFHPEASHHLDRTIGLIKDQGCQAGIALNPGTPLSVLDWVWGKLDLILVMAVNPGFAGQSFIGASLAKVCEIRRHLDAAGQATRLEVDGGVKVSNIGSIAGAGADTFVAGSAIFGAADIPAAIAAMRQAIAGATTRRAEP